MRTDLVAHTAHELSMYAAAGGVTPDALDAVESALGVILPADVRPIAAVFRGGTIGPIEHFSWSPADDVNVVERTRYFRARGLPARTVAVGIVKRRALYVLSADQPV